MWQIVQLLIFTQLLCSSFGSWRKLQDDMRRVAPVDLGTVAMGDPLSFDVTSYFPPNHEYLSLVGLSSGTGLALRRTGQLEGTFSSADKAKTASDGSLQFTVLARNAKQQLVQRDFIITIGPAADSSQVRSRLINTNYPQQQLPQPQQAQVQFRSVNVDHNISDIPDACQGRLFRFSAGKYFTSTNFEPLTYSLMAGTTGAFFIDPSTGDITGMIDLSTPLPPQPMELQVTAQDSSNLASFKLRVNFRQPGPLRTTTRPKVPKAFVGVPWVVDVGSSFSKGDFPVIISWDIAPPPGTGLRMIVSDGTTWIRGVPNEADFRGQRQLSVKADDGCSTAAMAVPISVSRPAPPTVLPCNTLVPSAYLRRAWFWDASACFESDTSLTFALSGLAPGTGLKIDTQTGAISGVILAADAAQTDFPWSATVTASGVAGAGGLSTNMTFFLWVKIPTNPIVLVPRKGQLPSLAWVGQTLSINYAVLFQSKNTLVYSLSGLPDNSGFRFSESLGTLSGTVQREAAAAVQPVLFIVSADDLMGGYSTFNHSITFVFPNIPEWRPFDSVPVAYLGISYSLDLYKQFRDPGQLNMSLIGLPTGSGLSLNASNGVLSGTPTQTDVDAAQLDLTLKVDDNRGGLGSFPFTIPVLDYQNIVEQPLPSGYALVNTLFSINLGLYFQARLGRSLTVSVSGLPSNFFFNPDTGLILGTATQRDFLTSSQPYPVLIQVSDGVSQIRRTWLLSIVEPNNSPTARQILAAEATSGIYFMRDIKPYFSDPDNQTLIYSISGLASGSGLTFDGVNGILAGVPNFADVTTSKPLALTVTADDRHYKGTVQAILSLTVRPVNNPPYISNPIPSPATAVAGRRFSGALSQHFVDPDAGDVLVFSINGLPPGSGLDMDTTGTLSGFPNDQDLAASPLRIKVKADDNRGGIVFGSFDLIVQPIILPPVALEMPSLLGEEGQPIFMNVKQYFQSLVPLQYVLDGLSQDTGIQLGFDSGLLVGIPTKVDVTGPNFRTVTVYVHNSQGGKAQGTFQLRVKPISRPPIALPIPNLQGTVGQTISYDMTKFFQDPDFEPLTYSISGLPRNSGLSLSPTGLFAGTPLAVDGNTSPLTLTVIANDDGGMQAVSVFILTLAKNYKAPMSDPIPPSRSVMGQPLLLDMKPYFRANTARALQFSISGLPQNSGLSIDRASGMLSGIPNAADFAASNQGRAPMRLLVLASEGGANGNSTLLLTVRETNTPPIVSTLIPPATATVGEVFVYDITTAFADNNNDDLIYGMTGMPSGAGLEIDAKEGVVHGTPSPASCLWAMPINLVISASDGMSPPITTPFALTIVCGDMGVHFVGSIPDGLAYKGKLWLLDMSPFFEYNGPYSLRFSGTGFPSGSGFVVAANGIAYGQPTQQDCKTFKEQKVIRIEADDGHANTDVGYFPFRTDCTGKTTQGAPLPVTIPLDAYVNPLMTLFVDHEFSFDVSQGFVQLRASNLQYTATGLPPGTGIKFDPYNIRVYGVPNDQDCANNPLTVVITGQNGQIRRQSVIFMMFPSCDPLAAPPRDALAGIANNFDAIAATMNNALFPPAYNAGYSQNSVVLPPPPNNPPLFLPPVVATPLPVPLLPPPTAAVVPAPTASITPVFTPSKTTTTPAATTATTASGMFTPSQPQANSGSSANSISVSVTVKQTPATPVSSNRQADPLLVTTAVTATTTPAAAATTVTTTSNRAISLAPSRPPSLAPLPAPTRPPPPSSLPSRPPSPLSPSPLPPTPQVAAAAKRSPSPPPSPLLSMSVAKCGDLGWYMPLGSKNMKVCATDSVNGPNKCLPVLYSTAQKLCADLGGRLCSAEELKQDVALGGSCEDLDTQVVWSRTPCQTTSGLSGILSTGGSYQSAAKGWCVAEPLIKNPARCCADFEPGTEFHFGGVTFSSDSKNGAMANVEWTWPAYRSFEVSVQQPAGKWGKAVILPAGQLFTLSVAGGPRTVRIVPIGRDGQPEKRQTRVVEVQSP